MRAIQMHEHGGPEVLRLEDLPTPQAGPGQLLIEVQAAGVNVADMASREPGHLDADAVPRLFYDPSPNQSLVAFNLGLYFGLRPETAIGALQDFLGFVASGQVKVPVGHVLPLAQAAEAHRLLEERGTTGKIVLKPWEEAVGPPD